MKAKLFFTVWLMFTVTTRVIAQGTTFIYDQQSATEATMIESNPVGIQGNQPEQSFTPSLSAVGFVRLLLSDGIAGNNQGAMVYLNLLSGAVNGPIVGTSGSVTMTDGFGVGPNNAGYIDFFFSTPVGVAPGTTYYIQPVVQSGDIWSVSHSLFYNYSGGAEYQLGQPFTGRDFWFREGIIVPEPSTWALLLLGGGAWLLHRRKVA